MSTGRVHVIGAGVAGLAAAVRLATSGRAVILHESAGHAGGRCRSFFDDHLGCRIDNGNHLMLSGNWAIREYLKTIGAENSLTGPEDAAFPFRDLRSGETWTVRPDKGAIPWSILSGKGRVPGTTLGEYLRALRLARAGADQTIQDCLDGPGMLYERFWEPLAIGVLNTPMETASARLLWPVIRETFGRGRKACRPLVAREGLSESFVTPALSCLEQHGGEVRLNDRLRKMVFGNARLEGLEFAGGTIELAAEDRVVSALPAWAATDLIPGLEGPRGTHAIVNAHFRLATAPVNAAPVIGLVGGTAQWVFVRGGMASVTVSAADDLAGEPNEAIAERLWPEVRAALGLADDAGMADREGKTGDHRPNPGRGPAPAKGKPNGPSGSGGGLDRNRAARDDRRVDPVRFPRGRSDGHVSVIILILQPCSVTRGRIAAGIEFCACEEYIWAINRLI